MSSVLSPRASPLLFLLAVVVGFVAGCVIRDDRYDEWCEEPSHACVDTTDCHSNQFCMRGFCEDLTPGSPTCKTSKDCPFGDVCVNGVCNTSCSRDSDCATGSVCDGYYCRVRPTQPQDGGTGPTDGGTRTPPRDGGSSWPTDGGVNCPPPPSSDVCVHNTECATGHYCINNACIRGCSADTDCVSTEMCTTGLCRPRPAATCTSAAHCASGNDCVDGTCRPPCSSTVSCPSGTACGSIGYCMPSPQPDIKVCSADCHCASGERCVEGRCGR